MNRDNLNRFSSVIASLLAVVTLSTAHADQAESLTYDPNTGIYDMWYYNTYDQETPVLHHAQFELETRINPTVVFTLNTASSARILYQYKITNGLWDKPELTEKLHSIRLFASHAYDEDEITPTGWHGRRPIARADLGGFLIGWFHLTNRDGIAPGSTQDGFSFYSRDLPGIGVIETWGSPPQNNLAGFDDMGPRSSTPIGKQYFALIWPNSIQRNTAVPRIPVPATFDASVVISGLKTHIDTDLVNLKLIDPVLVSQLDRSLQAAIDAVKINNISGAKANLRDARRLLKEQVPDVDAAYNFNTNPNKPKTRLIDSQAAWVINFDIQYVERRM